MFSAAEILELIRSGVTPSEIVELQRASSEAGAASTVAAPPKAKAATPDWIIQHGIRKAARRKLAADLTAKLGRRYTAAEWKKATKAAGLPN